MEVKDTDDYDACADEYAASVARREQGVEGDDLGILPRLLEPLGDAPDAGSWTRAVARATWHGYWQPEEGGSQASISPRA